MLSKEAERPGQHRGEIDRTLALEQPFVDGREQQPWRVDRHALLDASHLGETERQFGR